MALPQLHDCSAQMRRLLCGGWLRLLPLLPSLASLHTPPSSPPTDELIVGKPVSVVVGFINRGDRTLNVSRISGHVVDAVTGVVLQNLSSSLFPDGAVDGGTESAFEFVLTPTAPETTMAQASCGRLLGRAAAAGPGRPPLPPSPPVLPDRPRHLLHGQARALRHGLLQRHRDAHPPRDGACGCVAGWGVERVLAGGCVAGWGEGGGSGAASTPRPSSPLAPQGSARRCPTSSASPSPPP